MGGRRRSRAATPGTHRVSEILVVRHYLHQLRAYFAAGHARHGEIVSVRADRVGQGHVLRGAGNRWDEEAHAGAGERGAARRQVHRSPCRIVCVAAAEVAI